MYSWKNKKNTYSNFRTGSVKSEGVQIYRMNTVFTRIIGQMAFNEYQICKYFSGGKKKKTSE